MSVNFDGHTSVRLDRRAGTLSQKELQVLYDEAYAARYGEFALSLKKDIQKMRSALFKIEFEVDSSVIEELECDNSIIFKSHKPKGDSNE